MKNEHKIYIIGAGVSGLVAAIELEKQGYQATILEAAEEVGGRIRTDSLDGFLLDHGFQVLLDDYPMAKKYLDYSSLELKKLSPGAVIFHNGKKETIGDPLRKPSILFSTLVSSVGSLADKLKILKLNYRLSRKSIEAIFSDQEQSTLQYLQEFGFSDRMINRFFMPFFAGIFLETELKTSSRMFEFVYKMFGSGYATIPEQGISAISKQLANKLTNTEIKLNSAVKEVQNGTITMMSGERIESDFTIIASNPELILSNYTSSLEWKSCDTLYFKTKSPVIDGPAIGLISDPSTLINNIFHPTSITNVNGNSLLSVTIVKDHQLGEAELIEQVSKELSSQCGISDIQFIKRYQIKQALPDLTDVRYTCEPSELKITERMALAGDHQLSGSLNAAMMSGEKAAEAAIETITGNRI